MKGIGKTLLMTSVISVFLLLYVHEQISLFRLSYAIDRKSKIQAQRGEQYRHLKFEVDRLKAPRRLEEKLKELDLDLTLPKEIRIMRVPKTVEVKIPAMPKTELQPFSEGLMNFLGRWIKVAQATPDP